MVRNSGRTERTRESEAEDFVGGCGGICGGAIGRWEFMGAGVAGEFEPGIAGVDGRGARDQREHVGYWRVEFGVAVWIDFDESARTGIFERAIGVRVRRGAGMGADAEDEYGLWRRSESVCVQVDSVATEESEAVL